MESAYGPDDVIRVFASLDVSWWVAGGWAIDCHLRRQSREHEDLDIAVLRRDQMHIQRHLEGWDLQVALGPGSGLEPWLPGQHINPPLHAIWCREDPASAWAFEILLNDAEGRRWLFRRNHAITLRLADIGRASPDGIPYLRPEIILLYKAKGTRERDERDFHVTLPTLTLDERTWLANALSIVHSDHPWIPALRAGH